MKILNNSLVGGLALKTFFYTGAAPNQQAIPATDYFLEELGVKNFALLGTDYVYPRTTNNMLESYLMSKGIPETDIFVNYTLFGHSDWSKIVSDVVALGADGKKVGVISTINGDAHIGFYKTTWWAIWQPGTISNRLTCLRMPIGLPLGKPRWAMRG